MPMAPSTRQRLRNFCRIALIPESWFLEIIFIIGLAGVYRILVDRNDVMETVTWGFGVVLGLLSVPAVQLLLIPFAILLFWRGVRRLEKQDHEVAAKETAIRAEALADVSNAFNDRFSALDILTKFAACEYEHKNAFARKLAVEDRVGLALEWQAPTTYRREGDGPKMKADQMFSGLAPDICGFDMGIAMPNFEPFPDPVITEQAEGMPGRWGYDPNANTLFEAVLTRNKGVLRDTFALLEKRCSDLAQERAGYLAQLRQVNGRL